SPEPATDDDDDPIQIVSGDEEGGPTTSALRHRRGSSSTRSTSRLPSPASSSHKRQRVVVSDDDSDQGELDSGEESEQPSNEASPAKKVRREPSVHPVTSEDVARFNRDLLSVVSTIGAVDVENRLDAASDIAADQVAGQRIWRIARILAEIRQAQKDPGPRRKGLPACMSDTRDVALEASRWFWCPDEDFWGRIVHVALHVKRPLVHIGPHPLDYYAHPNTVTDRSSVANLSDPDGGELMARMFYPFENIPFKAEPLVFVNALWGAPTSAPSIMMCEVAVRRSLATLRLYWGMVEIMLLVPTHGTAAWYQELVLAGAEFVEFNDLPDFQAPQGSPPDPKKGHPVWEPPFLQHDCGVTLVYLSHRVSTTFEAIGRRGRDRHMYNFNDQPAHRKRALDAAIMQGIYAVNTEKNPAKFKCPWVIPKGEDRIHTPKDASKLKYDKKAVASFPALVVSEEQLRIVQRPCVAPSDYERHASKTLKSFKWVEAKKVPTSQRVPIVIDLDDYMTPKVFVLNEDGEVVYEDESPATQTAGPSTTATP
ncbi:hypothetical protein RI367_008842, partial [Sorochytrium milnesiophthora]